MNLPSRHLNVAVVGAGIAGAACAHALASAGHTVRVFDKSRGPGGRLATRRMEWIDRHGQARTTRLDHGAVGFAAGSASFRQFAAQAVDAGDLTPWTPALAADSLPLADSGPLYLPVPDMPALCRRLLDGTATWSCAVEALHRSSRGWQLEAGGERLGERFDAVLLALPPTQVAPLLLPHRRDWAERAAVVAMQPCWTLMGVADEPEPAPNSARDGELARPPQGILDWVVRNDARPGRQRVHGEAHWVVHARADWSRQHLEQPAAWVQAQLQTALAEWLGRPVDWRHCVVHRWRYAAPRRSGAAPVGPSWWDTALGLGVCGDFLGNAGVEAAWLSAQSLAVQLLAAAAPEAASTASTASTPSPAAARPAALAAPVTLDPAPPVAS